MSTTRKPAPSRSPAAPTTASLADFETFAALSDSRRKAVAEAVATELGDDFRAGTALVGEAKLASVVHMPSAIELVLVPGGSFAMGFSDADQAAVDACFSREGGASVRQLVARTAPLMRPRHEVQLRPFALARQPIDDPALLAKLLGEPHAPHLPREDAIALLDRWGFRFPSEAEWEYVAREGHGLSFLLDVVAAYLDGAEPRLETAWGVGQLGQAVWVGDRWHPNYANAPTDGSAWTDGEGRGMHRGSFWIGLSGMQTFHELVFAVTSWRVEPREHEGNTEVWLRLALGPDEEGTWRCQPKAPLPKPRTPMTDP